MKYMRNYADKTSFSEDSEVLSNIEQENKKWISYIKDPKGIKISLREKPVSGLVFTAEYHNTGLGNNIPLMNRTPRPINAIFEYIKVNENNQITNLNVSTTSSKINYSTISNSDFSVEFKLKDNVKDLSAPFNQCFMYTPIKTISNGFFNNFNGVIQIRECFKACTYLTTIPDKIFEKLQASDINGCFSGCTSLTTIPNNLFNYLPGLTDITYAFSGCTSLQSIPEDLIQNSNITAFDGLFNECTSLTGLTPKWKDGLELWEKEGTTGTDCFTGCTKLYNYPLIPEDWGGIQENYLVYQNAGPGSSIKIINDYSYVDSIRIIEGYQLYDIDMSNFNGYYITNTPYRYVYAEITVSDVPFTSIMFSGCTDLLKIPSKLYDSASGSLSVIIGDFEGCTNLRVIGKDLFASCTSLSDVGGIFDSCTSLKYIPSDLFRYNTSMQNFNSAFKNCTSLISSTPSDSNGNKLWQRNSSNGYIDNIDGKDCFTGCENLLDWEEIPDTWGGPLSTTVEDDLICSMSSIPNTGGVIEFTVKTSKPLNGESLRVLEVSRWIVKRDFISLEKTGENTYTSQGIVIDNNIYANDILIVFALFDNTNVQLARTIIRLEGKSRSYSNITTTSPCSGFVYKVTTPTSVDGPSAEPVSNAIIEFSQPIHDDEFTNSTGQYIINPCPTGEVIANFSYTGLYPASNVKLRNTSQMDPIILYPF